MAILKMIDPPIHPTKAPNVYRHLGNAIRYALNPRKTKEGLYTGSINCFCPSALEEMIATKKYYGKEPKSEDDRLGYHFVISWSPEEKVSPETATEIVRRFCEEILGEYELVYGTHLDRHNMHSHIVFNSVNYKTGHKYRYEKGDWERILQPEVDRLCMEYGLHTLEMDTGKTLQEHATDRAGGRNKKGGKNKRRADSSYQRTMHPEYNFSDYIRDIIDSLILSCDSFESFTNELKRKGFQVKYGMSQKYGEYMAVKNCEMGKFRRTHKLGSDYTIDAIKKRIAACHSSIPDVMPEEEEQYLLTGRFYRCRISFRTDNAYLRKQYARMFRLGVIVKGEKRPSYRETAKRLKQLRRLEYQIEMIEKHDYKTPADMEPEIKKTESEINSLKEKLKEERRSKKPYQKMLADFQKLEELEGAFLLYQEGEQTFKEEADRYARLQEQIKKMPHTREELEAYLTARQEREEGLKRKLREEKEKLSVMAELQSDYERVMQEYDPADDKMLEKMEQHSQTGTKKKRKEL